MTERSASDTPLMQRLYDRIWVLAVAAFLFWLLAYVVWGTVDIVVIPGVIGL